MSRLAVDIDPVAVTRNVFMQKVPDPSHAVVFAELGGAESIVCYLRNDQKSVNERDINVIKEISQTHLNVRCEISDDTVRKILKIKPDMVTFVAGSEKNTLEPGPVELESNTDLLENFVADFRANDIATSILIYSDISQLKIAGKLEFDYIEIDTRVYSEAHDLDAQVAELENINSLAVASNRMGMGVNASGGLTQENLSDLAKITFLDDLIVGNAILVKSISIGYEQAVRDFINILYK